MTSGAASTGGVPYLGSKISLVSKADIRYEGILYTIDPNECTVALAKVRSFGTEERPTDRPLPARDEIYEYIIFRGSDIKDLNICEPPKAQLTLAHLQDPAIVKQSGPVTSSASQQQSFVAQQSAPLVPSLSAAFSGALGSLPTSLAQATAAQQQNYIKAKIGDVASQIASASKKQPPPPLQTVGPKSPGPKSPKSPTKARRSPGNRRRGSGRVIPQSPKDALLAELMGPIAGLPQESARGAEAATAAASCVPQAAAAAPSGVEGSPSKGGRRRRRNGATLRASAIAAPSLVAPSDGPVAAAPIAPSAAAPAAASAEAEAKPQRSPRRVKATRKRNSSARDDSAPATAVAAPKAAPVAAAAIAAPAPAEPQPPISASTPSAAAPSRGRNAANRGAQKARGGRGTSVPTGNRGTARQQQPGSKQLFQGAGFQTNYFQGFQAGFNQALQQAYFNASVGNLFSPPLQRGATFSRRGRGRGLSRGNQGYIPRGGTHAFGSTSYTAREPMGSYQTSNRGRPFDPCNFVGDYDFEEANSKFDKGKVQEEVLNNPQEATGDPERDRENLKASDDASAALKAAVQEAAASLDGSAVAASGAMGGDMSIPYGAAENYYYYDRSKSFYDKISCTSIEKMRQQYTQPVVTPAASGNRVTWREARALNSETFGVPSVAAARRFVQGGIPQSHLYRISPSPRARGGRGGFFQHRSRGWSPRVRGSYGRGRGSYLPSSYYAGHINDYHGTDPSAHLTAALAAAAANLPHAKNFPTSPLVDANPTLSLPTKPIAPATPLAQSRLILEPTPSNTPTAISAAYSSSVSESAVRASAASATSLVDKIDLTDAEQTFPHVVVASSELGGDRGSTAEAIVNSVLSEFDADAASKLADELGQAAASASAQDSVLKELKEAADLPPPEPTALPTA